jgi:hypothetical protein
MGIRKLFQFKRQLQGNSPTPIHINTIEEVMDSSVTRNAADIYHSYDDLEEILAEIRLSTVSPLLLLSPQERKEYVSNVLITKVRCFCCQLYGRPFGC